MGLPPCHVNLSNLNQRPELLLAASWGESKKHGEPSCRTRSLKYLPEQMRADESTLTSAAAATAAAAAAAAAEVPVAPGAQGDATAAREDDRAADLVPEDDAAEAAHDEDQLRLQRGTGSAQGGTVDCAATTELTCSGTGSAQRGTAVTRAEAGPTSLAPDDDSAQGGAAVTRAAPAASRKRKLGGAAKRMLRNKHRQHQQQQ